MLESAMEITSGPRTHSVPALERGLIILEHLAQSRRGVTLSQLTSRLQLPRSTSHALLLTYQRCGYVQRDKETGRYRLGSRLHTLANMALAGHTLRSHCSSLLHRLMQETGATVHLAVMEQGEVILIDRVEPNGTARLATWVGKRMGLHCTALGKAILAHLPPGVFDDLIQRQGLIRYNENTIATVRKLRAACEQIRQLGYAVDDEEEEIGVRCIGAPIYNGNSEVVAAISISGPKEQFEAIPAKAEVVKRIAALLSQHIGPLWNELSASDDLARRDPLLD
jgi:DNA-binding IclR family transcriptional regulator